VSFWLLFLAYTSLTAACKVTFNTAHTRHDDFRPGRPGYPVRPDEPPFNNSLYGPPMTNQWIHLGVLTPPKWSTRRHSFPINGHLVNEIRFIVAHKDIKVVQAYIRMVNGQIVPLPGLQRFFPRGGTYTFYIHRDYSVRASELFIEANTVSLKGRNGDLEVNIGVY
jgi:hypothetical protein